MSADPAHRDRAGLRAGSKVEAKGMRKTSQDDGRHRVGGRCRRTRRGHGHAASAATNDPPKGVVPAAYDIVGVGSNTTQYVMDAFSVDYNKTVKMHNASHPYFYSWDALPLGGERPRQRTTSSPRRAAR